MLHLIQRFVRELWDGSGLDAVLHGPVCDVAAICVREQNVGDSVAGEVVGYEFRSALG